MWADLAAVLDAAAAAVIPPLAAWILVSGIDDAFVALAFATRRLWARPPEESHTAESVERRIAIFVPAWREARVIAAMLEHNLAAVRYRRYDFFVGAYPNDADTQKAVLKVAARFPNVHLCLCPHDGPTSKADCLNWVYQRLLLFEQETGAAFDIVLQHDAEDLIHPESLAVVNRLIGRYGMVQIPVLPLATGVREWTHGLYCDDFAEFHLKDLVVRNLLGGFVPSSGVGTAYSRDVIESLARNDSNLVFRPECLTEDYENGLRVHQLGFAQRFAPVTWPEGKGGQPVATREFFPRTFRSARRQRSRWITGIALQGWQRNGWRGSWGGRYWFWRDRKGLLGSPLSLAANLVFIYGAITWAAAALGGAPWGLGAAAAAHGMLLAATAGVGVTMATLRAWCSARVYGWRFALWSPLRTLYGNALNSAATFDAAARFTRALWRREALVWLKTEHAYPSLETLREYKRKLGDILVGAGYITPEQLEQGLRSQPEGVGIGQHLVNLGFLNPLELCEGLSLQQNLPMGEIRPSEVSRETLRSLPLKLVERYQVVPVELRQGVLKLACAEAPSDNLAVELKAVCRLEVQYHLVTAANLAELARRLELGAAAGG